MEFALIAPLMMAFTFGLIELGRITLVKQTATHASREGARVAVRPTAESDDVIERVNEELAVMGVNGSIEMEPEMIEDAQPGSQVTVRVRISLDSVSWVPGFFSFATNDIIAESSMRRESTN